ncbi:MAG: hypothetical protein ACK54F_02770 [Planctomycetia bacterium]|jgi:hypothetical protein
MTRRSGDNPSRPGFAWGAMLLVAVSTGCTMCPDPFDYSGPVPNGSAPQNDFWARSNGILPLNATPRPWPLIVKDDEQATPAEPLPAVIAESRDETTAAADGDPGSPAETRSVLR